MSMGGVTPRADLADVASPGNNTNIITSITPQMSGFFIVMVALATSSVFNVTVTRDGNERTFGLNKSNALNALDMYCFTFPVSASDAYNFQVETTGIIRRIMVMECSDFGSAQSAQGT